MRRADVLGDEKRGPSQLATAILAHPVLVCDPRVHVAFSFLWEEGDRFSAGGVGKFLHSFSLISNASSLGGPLPWMDGPRRMDAPFSLAHSAV